MNLLDLKAGEQAEILENIETTNLTTILNSKLPDWKRRKIDGEANIIGVGAQIEMVSSLKASAIVDVLPKGDRIYYRCLITGIDLKINYRKL